MEYPEEIYATRDGGLLSPKLRDPTSHTGWGRRHAYNIGCAKGYQSGYEAGKAEQAGPLEGYSNLTAAIQAGEPIDWERLDGLKAQCVHPTIENLTITMSRNKRLSESSFLGWHGLGMDKVLSIALLKAWYGDDGWTLWIEGEIPLARKTADQLEVGTYFRGEVPGYSTRLAYVGGDDSDTEKRVHYAPSMEKFRIPASEWVVLEEYGTFQKPDVK